MDWNYPGFTACLVSALVPSLAMTQSNTLSGVSIDSPAPAMATAHPALFLPSTYGLFAWERCGSLGNQPMGLKAQSCSGSDSLAGFMWPHVHQYLLPEVCGTWTLLSHSPGQVWLGRREQWVSMWLWPPVPLVLYKAKSSDSSLSCSKQWQHCHHGSRADTEAFPWHKLYSSKWK